MTKSQKLRLAITYRSMAGRCLYHLSNGRAEAAGVRDQIKTAHDALCRAFVAIEDNAEKDANNE